MNANLQLDLKPDEWVEVRSAAEILTTLDERGTLDSMPFMPEMLTHCGKRYQVFKRADKTCDTVSWTGLRRMENAVHLKSLRCDGSDHGGCQAGCLMFWKEAWLKRAVDAPASSQESFGATVAVLASDLKQQAAEHRAWLESRAVQSQPNEDEIRYRCQATELAKASVPLPWWKPGQYVRDVCHNRVSLLEVLRGISIAAFNKLLRSTTGRRFPNVVGTLSKTPTESLKLEPGEWVVVKSAKEILATLDRNGRNRGLSFDSEMLPYCGKRYKVLRRVDRLIDESTGRMLQPAGVSIILDNVICLARYRRSCPRSIFPYWREIWLERVEQDADLASNGSHLFENNNTTVHETCGAVANHPITN